MNRSDILLIKKKPILNVSAQSINPAQLLMDKALKNGKAVNEEQKLDIKPIFS